MSQINHIHISYINVMASSNLCLSSKEAFSGAHAASGQTFLGILWLHQPLDYIFALEKTKSIILTPNPVPSGNSCRVPLNLQKNCTSMFSSPWVLSHLRIVPTLPLLCLDSSSDQVLLSHIFPQMPFTLPQLHWNPSSHHLSPLAFSYHGLVSLSVKQPALPSFSEIRANNDWLGFVLRLLGFDLSL